MSFHLLEFRKQAVISAGSCRVGEWRKKQSAFTVFIAENAKENCWYVSDDVLRLRIKVLLWLHANYQ